MFFHPTLESYHEDGFGWARHNCANYFDRHQCVLIELAETYWVGCPHCSSIPAKLYFEGTQAVRDAVHKQATSPRYPFDPKKGVDPWSTPVEWTRVDQRIVDWKTGKFRYDTRPLEVSCGLTSFVQGGSGAMKKGFGLHADVPFWRPPSPLEKPTPVVNGALVENGPWWNDSSPPLTPESPQAKRPCAPPPPPRVHDSRDKRPVDDEPIEWTIDEKRRALTVLKKNVRRIPANAPEYTGAGPSSGRSVPMTEPLDDVTNRTRYRIMDLDRGDDVIFAGDVPDEEVLNNGMWSELPDDETRRRAMQGTRRAVSSKTMTKYKKWLHQLWVPFRNDRDLDLVKLN